MKLLITGFIQTFFIAINTFLIAKGNYIAVFFAAFLISYIWSWNVKKISLSTETERVLYALGAATGSVSGLWTINLLYFLFKIS